MWYVYHVCLQGNKHYVGSTRTLDARYKQHCDGTGSVWTRTYPPTSALAVVEVFGAKEAAVRNETATVKLLMGIYGISNVRGGAFSTLELSPAQIMVLQLELAHDRGACLRCGTVGHFAAECTFKPRQIVECCFRCGREGHYQAACTEQTHIDGTKCVK